MRYGHFDDQRREYVITRPDTPLPWINYLGAKPTSGSSPIPPAAIPFTAMPAAPAHALPLQQRALDSGGRYLYLRDNGRDFWSPSWQPTRTRRTTTSAATAWAIP